MVNAVGFLPKVLCACLCAQLLTWCEGKKLRFIVIADWGGKSDYPYTTYKSRHVARRMEEMADSKPPKFVLALGDNFYFFGVQNVHDPRFQHSFENVYRSDSMKIPWYVVAGNHDYRGNVSAQIAYSDVSWRWKFPNYYYVVSQRLPGTSDYIDIIMIDTIALCSTSKTAHSPQDVEDQWRWIERKLYASEARYLFTAGHNPIYSVGYHGTNSCLKQRLLPLLYKYKANGHFGGHDHCMQHLRTTQGNVTLDFIVSGAASYLDDSTDHRNAVPENSSKFHWGDLGSDGAFCFIEADSSNMTAVFIEADGYELYRTTILPRDLSSISDDNDDRV